jgi:hypothetical protein
MGFLCTPLMLWDIHNQRIIQSMGMAWDTGAPLWPYQTPDTILFAVNLPAFLISNLISNASDLYFKFGVIGPLRYLFFFPAVLGWWWLVGLYIDRRSPDKRRPILALSLCLLAVGLVGLGIEESRWAVRWWLTYSRTFWSATDLILLRLLAPTVWCIALGLVALSAAWRRARVRPSSAV